MIARLVLLTAVAVAVLAGVLALGSGEKPRSYEIVFDNAFGLTEGADLKAAGVRVGSVAGLDVDERTAKAVVTVEIEDESFGDFRSDVQCSVEPQSLIGEYFLNCAPGTAARELEPGSRIPVEQTTGTIPPDLVNNILRRPWRERFGIILTELGAGLAARGPDLQATIRRALPALRETDRVLAILADNRQRLRTLTRESDVVLGRLARRREDVARFVVEARDTASATAERRVDLATDIRLLPQFLRELRPVLRDLGTTARRQTPALRDLRIAAPRLGLVFERLAPFSRAALPALRSLGQASKIGVAAMQPLRATAREAGELGPLATDPARNLRYVLEHVDDRDQAVEENPLSPGGKGFTGLEALLQYPFVQSQAINIFDVRGYLLKLNVLPSPCSAYADDDRVREDPELREQCSAALGPGPAFGIDGEPAAERRSDPGDRAPAATPTPTPAPEPTRPAAPSENGTPPRPADPLPPLPDEIEKLLEALDGPLGRLPQGPGSIRSPEDQAALLDFLLGP